MITVYTKNNCQPCKFTKRKLEEKGINYHEVNVDSKPGAVEIIQALGFQQAPVVIVSDDHPTLPGEKWSGLRIDKINELAKEEV